MSHILHSFLLFLVDSDPTLQTMTNFVTSNVPGVLITLSYLDLLIQVIQSIISSSTHSTPRDPDLNSMFVRYVDL